ncbi:MAG: N-acetylmuramic acid 6-phosphate etherase [Pseudarcicella sp.]|nr:N-acetylmuramic acid 6-phosphate etherase [Pseudarcicella sp.]MBP6410085.1 N-acetylmuramic acid 6-phosphate etherase [Pseudarcicella sp.]
MTTESSSLYDNLEKMTVNQLLVSINQEDKTVAFAVEKSIPQIEELVTAIVPKMQNGGRLFYIGAGTSGRLGVVDASECPPTFGVAFETVVGLIAGGDTAIRKAVENAEDNEEQAWLDLQAFGINTNDSLIGIAASGRTPYVVGGLQKANEMGIVTGAIVCNTGSKLATVAQYPIEVPVGAEFVTGSTRMKAGTAQKMVLNMISTSMMIQMGKVKGNKMVDMQLTNHKLEARAKKMIMEELQISQDEAESLLSKYGNVRSSIDNYRSELG